MGLHVLVDIQGVGLLGEVVRTNKPTGLGIFTVRISPKRYAVSAVNILPLGVLTLQTQPSFQPWAFAFHRPLSLGLPLPAP